MFSIFKKVSLPGMTASNLYDNQTFYRAFERDLSFCQSEVLIESPFITVRRVNVLLPLLQKTISRGVRVTVNTKPIQEYKDYLYFESEKGIAMLQSIGVEMLYTGEHRRKLAVFDRQILWEGSLNILSQNDSCEIMRRIDSNELARQMLNFTNLDKYILTMFISKT